jgi:hypothetical protein
MFPNGCDPVMFYPFGVLVIRKSEEWKRGANVQLKMGQNAED